MYDWREAFMELDYVMQDGGSLSDPMPDEVPRWLVVVRVLGEDISLTVFSAGPGVALHEGIITVLSGFPEGTQHQGA